MCFPKPGGLLGIHTPFRDHQPGLLNIEWHWPRALRTGCPVCFPRHSALQALVRNPGTFLGWLNERMNGDWVEGWRESYGEAGSEPGWLGRALGVCGWATDIFTETQTPWRPAPHVTHPVSPVRAGDAVYLQHWGVIQYLKKSQDCWKSTANVIIGYLGRCPENWLAPPPRK